MTLDCRSIVENCLLRDRGTNMIDLCLSALATAWLITFVATTGFVAALAAETVWDQAVYEQTMQHVVIAEPPY